MSTTPEYMPWEEQSLKTKLFTFHGRLSRRHYIYLTILTWVLAGAISYLLHTASATLGTMTGGICLIVAVILAIPTTIISLSIAVRRWHDLNKSWQYVLINVCCAFAGVFSLFLYAYLFIAKGTPGKNLYGPNPAEPWEGQAEYVPPAVQRRLEEERLKNETEEEKALRKAKSQEPAYTMTPSQKDQPDDTSTEQPKEKL